MDAINGRTEEVKTALAHGAAVDGVSRGLRTPLHNAARKGYLDIVKLLCDHSANLRLRSLLDKGECFGRRFWSSMATINLQRSKFLEQELEMQ